VIMMVTVINNTIRDDSSDDYDVDNFAFGVGLN
jgi:hypothetical protein